MQPNWCKDNIIYCSKLTIKTNLLIKLLILKSITYSCKAVNGSSHLTATITPYTSGNKSVILFLFFRENLIKFFRLFNLGLASLSTISFILLDLKTVTKHSVRDRIVSLSATRLKKSKRWKPNRKSSAVKSSRRKVTTPIPSMKLSSKKVTTLRREYMLLYGRFLTFRQRKAKPQLPKRYKNRFLKRHSGITSAILKYRKIKSRSNLLPAKKGRRVLLKTNVKKFARLSFFLDTTFTKTRAEMSLYKKKEAAICLAAERLASKKRLDNPKEGGLASTNDTGGSKLANGNKDVYRNKFRSPKVIRITTYRGIRIRKKILRSGREVQRELNDVVRRFRGKTKQKPLQSLESFSRSTNGVMLD